MTFIKKVELHEFKFPVNNLGNLTGANSVGAFGYSKGEVSELKKFAIKIITDDGTVGEYGVLNISGNQNSSANVGAIKFLNRENSNSSSGSNANSRRLASIDCFADTSDSNGGDDSGGGVMGPVAIHQRLAGGGAGISSCASLDTVVFRHACQNTTDSKLASLEVPRTPGGPILHNEAPPDRSDRSRGVSLCLSLIHI